MVVEHGEHLVPVRLVEWLHLVAAGGGNPQTMISPALREYMEGRVEPFEETLRRVLEEVLPGSKPPRRTERRREA